MRTFLILLLLLVIPAQGLGQSCPSCLINNMNVPDTNGRSANGRPIITLQIDSSWNDAPNHTTNIVWNAVTAAVTNWNNATDAAGNGAYYEIKFDATTQATDSRNVNIHIIKDDKLSGPRGQSKYTQHVSGQPRGPYNIHLRPDDATACDLESLIEIIAHEIGHIYGLHHRRSQHSNCNSNDVTIMDAPAHGEENCMHVPLRAISQKDIQTILDRQNSFSFRTGNCKHVYKNLAENSDSGEGTPTPTPVPTPPNCTDWDHDNICVPHDCDDFDPFVGADQDGDGYCAPFDCDDFDNSIYPNAPINPNTEGGEDRNCNGVDDAEEAGNGRGCTPAQMAACESVGANCRTGGYCYTPILVDPLGDGLRLTNPQNGIQFDIGGGLRAQISWTRPGSDDAWLALDRNNNGRIDSGNELFGNFTPQPPSPTPNGFLALAVYDQPQNGGNADGRINRHDAIFSSLRLWQDMNHNGISESSELHRLSSLDVKAIDLEYRESRRMDRHGNLFKYRAKVYDSRDASVGRWAWDVVLRIAP